MGHWPKRTLEKKIKKFNEAMITAEEARKRLNSESNKFLTAEINDIQAKVIVAIERNNSSININALTEQANTKLKDLSYTIVRDMKYDQRQEEYESGYIISW
jgi:hypothetical protein